MQDLGRNRTFSVFLKGILPMATFAGLMGFLFSRSSISIDGSSWQSLLRTMATPSAILLVSILCALAVRFLVSDASVASTVADSKRVELRDRLASRVVTVGTAAIAFLAMVLIVTTAIYGNPGRCHLIGTVYIHSYIAGILYLGRHGLGFLLYQRKLQTGSREHARHSSRWKRRRTNHPSRDDDVVRADHPA
jgi:hypothetical protein